MLDDLRMLRAACRLSGEVDVAVAGAVETELMAVAIRTEGAIVELDCKELTFIDASGITMLLRVSRRSGKRVRLVNLARSCRRVFEVLDLCEHFGIEESTQRWKLGRTRLPA